MITKQLNRDGSNCKLSDMKLQKIKSAKSGLLFIILLCLSAACATKPATLLEVNPEKKDKSSASDFTPKAGSISRAAYIVEQKEGLTLVHLSTKDAGGNELLNLTVAPEAGTNIVSIHYRGTEVLEQPLSLKDVSKQDAGIEFLYPTPNRVANSELVYKDLKLKFTPNLGAHFIHGLAREQSWNWEEPQFRNNSVIYKTWLDVKEGSEFYKQFPIKNRIELTIVLADEQINFSFNVANLDQRSFPFGVGTHPYFKLHGTRADSSVQIPVTGMMEAVDLIPTGKVIPLKATKYAKLASGMTIQEALDADTVFYPTLTKKGAQVREPDFNFEITASKDFGHTVLWAPPTRELFAVENQTSSTDAHNLANKGFKKESGLIVLPPGAKWSGSVNFRFSKK